MKRLKRIVLTWLALLLLPLAIYAQNGTIRGVVIDGGTNETLVGAAVVIKEPFQGVTTNLDGEYVLDKLTPGKYDLHITYISYDPLIIENVVVEANKTVTLNVKMSSATQQLQTVSVVARRVQHTDVSIINSIKTAELVVSGVSAQQISRSQDRDASQVVRRIPGVTIIEDRFIVVRGLNERYNAVQLNDINAPSLEDDVRSFSFDVIPSSQLERILIYKSPSPDLPGDFAGGVIKIYTKSIPDESGMEVNYSIGYEPSTTFKDFYITERYSGHWSGLNRGHYDLPSGVPSDIRKVSNATELQRIGQSFKNNWVPEKNTAFFNQSASVTGYLKKPLGSMVLGNYTSVNYSNSFSSENPQRYDYNTYDRVNNTSLPIYWFDDNKYKQTIKLGLIHNYGLRINPNHSVEFKNLFNNIGSYEYVNRGGNHYDFEFFPSNHSFQQLYRTIYTGQLSGKHDFFDKQTQIQWLGGYSTSNRDMPDNKRYRSDLEEVNGSRDNAIIYVPIGGAQPYFLGRFYSEMDETTITGSLNITQKISFGEGTLFKPVLKAGAYIEEKDRSFLARNIGYTQAINFNLDLRLLPIDQLFAPENINNNGGIKIDEQSNPQDSYEATSSLKAYYGMLTLPVTSKIKIIGGIRIEDYTQTMKSATTDGPVNEVYQKTDLLPSVNIAYSFSDKMLVRGAYGKTVNRPEFRERAPFNFYDFNFNVNKKGNIFLADANINNMELRWEYYPTVSEMINFGGFYKKFENPIESGFEAGAGSGGAKNFRPMNAKSAVNYGLELEVRKSLAGLFNSAFFDKLMVVFNGAIIKSEVEIGTGIGSGRDTDNRPLQGQSPYIVNTGLFYNNEDKGLQVNLLYNTFGKRIYSVGYTNADRTRVLYPDVYEMPRHLLDFTANKTFKNNVSIKLGITDLFNQKSIFLQDANEDEKFEKNNDQILQSSRPGTLFTLGIGYKF